MTIAGMGLKHAGTMQASDLRKLNKPKEHLYFLFRRKLDMKDCKTVAVDSRVGALVHPFMANYVMQLSMRANVFRYAVPRVLALHGHETIEHQMDLRRIADVAIDLYMCCAVASRCSHAITEGHDNVDHELDLATCALNGGLSRSDANNMKITYGGQEIVSDEVDVQIADKMLKDGGYCALHPLTRNW